MKFLIICILVSLSVCCINSAFISNWGDVSGDKIVAVGMRIIPSKGENKNRYFEYGVCLEFSILFKYPINL